MDSQILDQLRALLGEGQSSAPSPMPAPPVAPAPAPMHAPAAAPLDFSSQAVRPRGKLPESRRVTPADRKPSIPVPRARPKLKQPLDFSETAIEPGSDYSLLERAGQNTLELFKGIPAGVGGTLGSSLKGTVAIDAHRALKTHGKVSLHEAMARIPQMTDEEFGQLLDEGNKLPMMAAIGFRNNAMLLRSGKMTPEQYMQGLDQKTDIKDAPMVKAGDWLTEKSDIFPAAPGFENSVGRNLGQGLGSVAAGVGTTLATGGLGGAAIFTAAGSGEALQRAIDAGATDEQILEAARLGAIPGLTDQIPIETLLKSGISPSRWPIIAVALAKIGKQAVIEGLQEGGQEFLQNLIEQHVYNPEQELTEGLPGSAGLGAGVGGIVEGVNQGARLLAGRRARHSNTETQGPDQGEVSPSLPEPDLQTPASAQTPPSRAGAENAGAAGVDKQPTIDDVDPEHIAVLTSGGYDADDIIDMSPDERLAEVESLLQQGVKPDFSAVANVAKGAGTRTDPAHVQTASDMDRASEQVNQQPTDGQKKAGNYAKGHIKLHGMDIAIENPKGSTRSGKDPDGKSWSVTMPGAYGEIKRTEGADGDPIDVFIGDNPESDFVLVVDQIDPTTGKFDEHKAILGTNGIGAAIDLYKASYSDDANARIGNMAKVPLDEFKRWARSGDTTKPFTAVEPELDAPEPISPEKVKKFTAYIEDIGAGNLDPERISQTTGIDPQEASRLLSDSAARGDIRLDNATGRYRRKGVPNSGLSLMQSLAAHGGIQDEGGELTAIGIANKFIPGRGKLVRKSGMTLDQAREFAVESGYLRDQGVEGGQSQSTVRDLLDALDKEEAGEKQLTERDQNDQVEPYDREADEQYVARQIELTAQKYEIIIPEEDIDFTVKVILDEGLNVEDGIVRAAVLLAQNEIPKEYADIDIPFFDDADIEADPDKVYEDSFEAAIADLEAEEKGTDANENGEQQSQESASDSSAETGPESQTGQRPEPGGVDTEELQTSQGGSKDAGPDEGTTGQKTDTAKSAPEHAHNVGKPLDESNKYEPVASGSSKVSLFDVGTRQEIPDKDFLEITDEFAAIFETPEKSVRLAPQMRKAPYISIEDAQARIETWKDNARNQGKTHAGENSDRTILSLFDLTGQWSRPYEEAGYNVIRFDIQSGQDVMDFSVDYFNDNWDFGNVFGILAACPCTDFASSGAKWFKDKDADGRTEASKELVFQTMKTIEYFRPIFWALENPVGRIGRLTGLPPYRMSFDPNHFGEPYTKKTVLYGNFETDLPTAYVEPTEGSKMWKQYGGKSQATKNARSETPQGFAYSFFQANNAVDMDAAVLMPKQYPEASGAISAALKAGVPIPEVEKILYNTYENFEYDDARKALYQAAQNQKKPSVNTEKVEPSVEPGADNKPQLVMPGFERISEKEEAELKGSGKLSSKKEQKEPGGLFSDEKDQSDAFSVDEKPKKPDADEKVTSPPQDEKYEALVDAGLVSRHDFGQSIQPKKKINSNSRAKNFPATYADGEIYLSHPLSREIDVVRKAAKLIGVTPKFDPDHRAAHGAMYHAIDLAKDEHIEELLSSKEWTDPKAIETGVGINLSYKQLSTDNAKKILDAFNIKEPDAETVSDELAKAKISKLDGSRTAITFHQSKTPGVDPWVLIRAISGKYVKYDRSGHLQATSKLKEFLDQSGSEFSGYRKGTAGMKLSSGEKAEISDLAPEKHASSTVKGNSREGWMLVEKATGKAVMETKDRKKVDALNTEKYEAIPIREYLASLNEKKDISEGWHKANSDKEAVTPTVKSTVKKTGMGIQEAVKGLDALFNDPNKLGSGPVFDEDTYKKALPYFKAAAAHFKDAANDIAQMVALMVKSLSKDYGFSVDQIKAMKPYLKRFIMDIKAGKETLDDVSDSSTDLEPDSADAAPADGLGPQNIPAAGSKDGRRPGSPGGSSTRGGSAQQGNPSVSGTDAPLMGEAGNSSVSGGKQPGLATDTDRDGGRGDRDGGAEPTVDSDGSGKAVKRVGKDTRLSNAERAAAQVKAENVDIKVNDEQNIRDTLPILYPLQQGDVIKAERRFFGPKPGFGMLYTNGTGTGKTFTGLGIVKRFQRMGKENILIVSPAQPINEDWVSSGELLGIDISILPDIQSAGDGVVVTTYANLEANNELIKRDWDLVIADESHKLMSNGKFETTGALKNVRALTRHPEGKFEYHRRKRAEAYAKLDAMVASKNKTQAQIDAISELHNKLKPLRELDEAEFSRGERKPVVFLSATPFPYDKSIDYANGYLFDYPEIKNEKMGDANYNVARGRDAYFVQHFGYRMVTNKLTQPEADVDQSLMQRAWHENLRKSGALSGRQLEVEADYERKFALVESLDGKKIDQAFAFMLAKGNERFRPLYDVVYKKFDYLRRAYLLEAIKAKEAIPIIKKHHALGRKVVVFHEFNKGGGFNPFSLVFEDGQKFHYNDGDGKQASIDAYELLAEFFELNPYAEHLDFSEYRSPIETLKAEFPNVMIFGGKTDKKDKAAMKKAFNADGTENNLIAINSAAGEAGISLHDTTGEHQRVIINLGLPNRPVTAIQTEGRIYRVGQVSDAIFIYMDTGTNWERHAFAMKMAKRAGTAENLALGNLARNLQQSYVDGYLESDIYEPSKNEGKGGKEADRPAAESISAFDMAKTYYFAKQKIRDKRSQRAGADYFATPEPLGLKMVEWSRATAGDEVLEPSAGHGAISRFFPEGSNKRIIEPSPALGPEAALNTPGAELIQSDFEDHNIINKYDAIVMNPPFGTGGSDAIPHLKKAFGHLRPGGRVVAILPMIPAADKKFNAWWESVENAHLIAEIKLPTVTFERAGTKVPTRVVVIDRAVGKDAEAPATKYWNYTGSDTIKEFFDRLEQGSELPDRVRPPKEDSEEAAAPEHVEREVSENTVNGYVIAQTMHAKKGFPVFVAQIANRVDKDSFKELAGKAKAAKGWYSSYSRDGAIPGFQFKSEQARDAFVENNPIEDGSSDTITAFATEAGPAFYSPLFKAVEGAKQKQAPAKDWKAIIAKLPGVKQVEIDWLGVNEWLDMQDGQVPRETLLEFIQENLIDLKEIQLASKAVFDYDMRVEPDDALNEIEEDTRLMRATLYPLESHDHDLDDVTYEGIYDPDAGSYYFEDLGQFFDEKTAAFAAEKETLEKIGFDGPSQFEEYTEEDGDNYREILLTVPNLHTSGKNDIHNQPYAEWDRLDDEAMKISNGEVWKLDPASRAKYDDLIKQRDALGLKGARTQTGMKKPFVEHTHFAQKNIVVHARVTDRSNTDDKKVLFVEEIQSDLATKWREGTESPEITRLRNDLTQKLDAAVNRLKSVRTQITDIIVPKANAVLPTPIDMSSIDITILNAMDLHLHGQSRVRPGSYAETITKTLATELERMNRPDLIEEYRKAGNDQSNLQSQVLQIGAERTIDPALPDTPFKEEATYNLMVRRLLREAAEKGYDKLAWTPGYMQAERWYNAAQSVVDEVRWSPYPDVPDMKQVVLAYQGAENILTMSEAGVISGPRQVNGKTIVQILGPSIGRRVMEEPSGSVSGQKITFHDSGYAIAYDQQIKKAVAKFAKKYGGRVVSDRDIIETGRISHKDVSSKFSAEDIRYVLKRHNIDVAYDDAAWNEAIESQLKGMAVYGSRFKQTPAEAAGLIATRHLTNLQLTKAFDLPGIPVWSIEITPEMRTAALRGFPMFQLGKLTPLAQTEIKEIERRVTDVVRSIAGSRPNLRFDTNLGNLSNEDPVQRSGGGKDRRIAGAYQSPSNPSVRPIIHIALSLGNDPQTTAAHESWHHLEFSGLITPAEMEMMTREDGRLRAFVAKHEFKTHPDNPRIVAMPTYEIRAYAFQIYHQRHMANASKSGLHIGIRRFFDRLLHMFRKIRNALAGMGYRTTEDIFASAIKGDIKKRKPGGRRKLDENGDIAFATHGHRSNTRATYTMPGEDPLLPSWLLGRALNRFLPTGSEIITKVQDRFHPVNLLQKGVREAMGVQHIPEHVDTYMAESLYYGRVGERLNSLRLKYIDPLTDWMHDKGVSMVELNDYLYARHAPERNIAIAEINPDMPDGGSGMKTREAKALMAQLMAQDNAEAIKEAAKKVDDITRKARKTLFDNGLISAETLQSWEDKYAYYVPLRGFENDPDTNTEYPQTGRGFDVRGKEAQPALGRYSKSEQPLLYAVQQAEQAIIRAEKNRVAKTFLRFIKKHPNKDLFEVTKAKRKRRLNPTSGIVEEYWVRPEFSKDKNLFAVKIGGKLTWVQIHHPALARAMRHMGSENLGAVGAALAKFTRYLAMVNTSLNPEFVVSNMARDMQTALVNISETEQPGIRRQIVKAVPAAMKGVYRASRGKIDNYWTRRHQEFAQHGGKIGFYSMQNIDSIRSDLEAALKDQNVLRRGLRGTFKWIDNANGAVENALRLATFDALLKRGYTPAKAASAARELTVNFNRKGEWGVLINALYLFFNAALQGSVRMGMAMYRSPTARKIAVGMVGVGIALDFINHFLSDDDDDGKNFYDKIPQWEKERNIILMVPGSETGEYLKIPLAYGYNVFTVLGNQIGGVSRGVIEPTTGAANMASAMINAFMPVGTGATALQTATPTFARPFVEIAENKDWFGGPIYPAEFPNSYAPKSSQAFSSISPAYQWIAESLNKLTGGNEVRSGLVDFSPEVFEHLINFTTGGAGTFWLDRAPDTAARFAKGEPWLPEKTPFVRRVFGKKSEYIDRGTYYDMRDEVMALRYEIKEFSEDGNQAGAKAARDRNPNLTAVIPMFEASERKIRQINKMRRLTLESKTLSREKQDTEIKRLEEMKLDVMREARKAYYSKQK